MKTRIALTCLIAFAFSGTVQAADLIVPSHPFRPTGPDQVLAGFMQTMLKDKSLSAKQRADVLGKIQRAEKLGDPDIAITESLMAISPDFAKALSLLGDEDLEGAKALLKKVGQSKNEYLSANADFFLARAYVAEERYEDALPLFKALAGPEKSDKTLHAGEALFYKGVCQNQLISRSDALVSFTTFLRQNADASERLLVGAQHMVDELRLIEDGSLWDVQTRMDFSRRHLDLKWTNDPTQKQQVTIVTMLDKLIEEAERKENSGGGGGGGGGGQGQGQGQGPAQGNQQPSSPAQSSTAPAGEARMGALHNVTRGKAGDSWGNLKEKEKQEVINAFKAKFPARYRKAVEEYYKKLQEGPSTLD